MSRKIEKEDKLKIKNLCVKKLRTCDIRTKNISGVTGSFSNLSADNANITNLNVDTINGVDPNCAATFNVVGGVIKPVIYSNGEPVKPSNDGTFNQDVLDLLWNFNLIAAASINLDADSGRLRNTILSSFYGCTGCQTIDLSNCPCPLPGFAIFTGSIASGNTGATGTILTVTEILDNDPTNHCPGEVGTIQIGQSLYGLKKSFYNSTIVSQLSGSPGGIGSYLIENDFNDYRSSIESETMLSLSNLIPLEECVNVPLRIYGVETLSVSKFDICSSIISSISYNFNIVNRTLTPKLASVYVQVAWKVPDSEDPVQIRGIEVDSRQFDPSILSFGEQMNNTVFLPTEFIESIAINNLFSKKINAVLQLVVYIEDGLKVLIPEEGAISSKDVKSQAANSVRDNFSLSFNKTNAFDLQSSIPIPSGTKTVRYTLYGAGGGGGSGSLNGGGGGGGGSGYFIKDTVVNLNENNYTNIEILLGKGGSSDQDGGASKITFTGPNAEYHDTNPGGKKGEIGGLGFFGVYGGNGGDGYFGGGGGAPDGRGGAPYIVTENCGYGNPGVETGILVGDGGNGGTKNCMNISGIGGKNALMFPFGGGGGGGEGAGNGQNDTTGKNGNATGFAGGGGGGAGGTSDSSITQPNTIGGNGSDGYIEGPFFS